jgi:hypothetical protein
MGNLRDGLFPVVNDKVVAYHEYFNHDENIVKKYLPSNSIKTDLLTTPTDIENGGFVIMETRDFEEAFLQLYKNIDKLPSSEVNLFH